MGTVTVQMDLNDKGFSTKVEGIRRQAKQLQTAMKDVEHQTVNSMQASSAAIRVLEGNMTNNIRAAERFISTIPGVGKALQAAFPVVGALAFAGVISGVVKEIANFVEKTEKLPQSISNGFRELNLSAQTANDAMRVTNDRLTNEIAKLQGRPQNNLALAIDEARVAADKLAESLDADNSKIAALLERNHGSALGAILGKAGTADVEGSINSYGQKFSDIGAQRNLAVHQGDNSAVARLDKALADAQASALNYVADQMKRRQSGQGFGDQSANINDLQGFRTNILEGQDRQSTTSTNAALQAQKAQLDAAKAMSDAMKKAQGELLKQFENQEKEQNSWNKLSVNEEIAFWSARLEAFRRGSEQYIAVQDKIYGEIAKRPNLFAENKKNQATAGKFTVEGNELLGNAQKALAEINIADLERQNKLAEKYNQVVAQGAEIAARNKAIFDEANVSIGLEQGTMSKLAAAQELAKIHTREHADELRVLNEQLAIQVSLIRNDPNPNLSSTDRASALQNAQDEAGNKAAALNGGYAVTQAQDAAAIQSQTISGAAKDSLATMVQNFNDMASTLKTIIPQTIESMNDQIVNAITGKKTDFGKVFSQTGDSLIKASLQKLEGSFLSAAGVGKPDGSKNNPIYTMNAGVTAAGLSGNQNFRPFFGPQQGQNGGQGNSSGSVFGNFIHGLFGGGKKSGSSGGDGGDDGDGTGFDSVLQSFGKGVPTLLRRGGGDGSSGGGGGGGDDGGGLDDFFQGAFARGGNVLANRMALVGERGPELFLPHTAGRIVPNHQLGGGGDTHIHYNIDARGATDPAAVHAAVMRAAPHIAAGAVQAQHSMGKRTPRGR